MDISTTRRGRKCGVILAILVVFCLFCLGRLHAEEKAVPVSGHKDGYILDERFNELLADSSPEGWIVKPVTGAVVKPFPFAADKSMVLCTEGNMPSVSAARRFTPVSGMVTVELKFRAEKLSGRKQLPALYDSEQVCVLAVTLDGEKIISETKNGPAEIQAIQKDIWYVIRIVVDTAEASYDLYVDGIRKLRAAPLKHKVSELSSIVCAIADGSNETVYCDNIKVYTTESLIGKPPSPVFDVTGYGAVGDGKTLNTKAIQAAIDACGGTGGSVYIPEGVFVTGTLRLKSKMTLFVSPKAMIWGSAADEHYPEQYPPSKSHGMGRLKKALIYAENADGITIDGGGIIDGNGSISKWKMNGSEWLRPILVYPVKCTQVTVRNVYLRNAAMWCLVPLETHHFTARNVYVESRDYGNRDGIDLTDTHHVLIENCTLNTDDDIICPKSGRRSGVADVTVRDCYLLTSVRANGIKFGTASYGQFRDMLFEDILIKNCDKAAIALESVDGADIRNIVFRRIDINHTNSPFYLVIGKRQGTPADDVKKMGSIENILFEDVIARNLRSRIGCPISGNTGENTQYPIKSLTFKRCDIIFLGGRKDIPKHPPEMGTQYPECVIWGDMPAYGYFIRHAENVRFIDCKTAVFPEDARSWRVLDDVVDVVDR